MTGDLRELAVSFKKPKFYVRCGFSKSAYEIVTQEYGLD
jgi:hypothetical protein